MLLYDLLKPNKYGTVPMLDIYGVGHIYTKDGVAYLKWNYDPDAHIIDPKQTIEHFPDIHSKDRYYIDYFINMPASKCSGDVQLKLVYLKVATAEERLIKEAVLPKEPYFYINNNVIWNTLKPHKILPNGSGWDSYNNPVTYYVEDILYRLDLQQELT